MTLNPEQTPRVPQVPDEDLQPIPLPEISVDAYECPKCACICSWDQDVIGGNWFLCCPDCGWRKSP